MTNTPAPTGDDDTALLQAAIATGHADLGGMTYVVRVRPYPRPWWSLDARNGATIHNGTILFRGDLSRYEYRGIQVGSDTRLHHLTLDASGTTNANEHSPVIRGDGPLEGVVVDHCRIVGGPAGDAGQFVGYLPAVDGTNDRRIVDLWWHHNVVDGAGRSGLALRGVTCGRVNRNVFRGVRDQDIDTEGDQGSAFLTIDGNLFDGSGCPTGLSVTLERSRNVDLTNNEFRGRGYRLWAVQDCEARGNRITKSVPGWPGAMVASLCRDVTLVDEVVHVTSGAGSDPAFWCGTYQGTPVGVAVVDCRLSTWGPGPAAVVSGQATVEFLDTVTSSNAQTP